MKWESYISHLVRVSHNFTFMVNLMDNIQKVSIYILEIEVVINYFWVNLNFLFISLKLNSKDSWVSTRWNFGFKSL